MDQNLNYYKIFFEVAKTGNISKAAQNLYISQPAVSKSITKLEQNLKCSLFIRSKKGVHLTEEGSTLYEHLNSAFQAIENAELALQNMSTLGLGQIRIGVSTSLCKHILLPYLQDFIEDNPHVKINIACNPTFETIHLLKEGKIDLGLICDTALEDDFAFVPLHTIQDTFITTQTYIDNLSLRESNTNTTVSKKEPLQDFPNITGAFFFPELSQTTEDALDSLSTKDILEKGNLMLLDQGNISRQYIDQYLSKEHIKPRQVLEINNMDLLIDFASIGIGIACVVREFITSYLEQGQVIELPLSSPIPNRTIGFIYHKQLITPTTKRFLDSI